MCLGSHIVLWAEGPSDRMVVSRTQGSTRIGEMIDSYSFGRIVVDGKTYTADVIIYPDRVQEHWVRRSGHSLDSEDLKGLDGQEARTLVVGTGNAGLMRVPAETLEYLTSTGFEVIVQETGSACDTYNRLSKKGLVIAALHLSC